MMPKMFMLFFAFVNVKTEIFKNETTLQNDIQQLLDICPYKVYMKILKKHLQEDPEFANAVVFLQSSVWKNLVISLERRKEFQILSKYLELSNFPLLTYLKKIQMTIDNADTSKANGKSKGDFKFFLMALPPFPKIEFDTLLKEKQSSSPEFNRFYSRLTSDEAQNLYRKVIRLPESFEILQHLKDLISGEGWRLAKNNN